MTKYGIVSVLILLTALMRVLLRRVLPKQALADCWLLCLGVLLLPWQFHTSPRLYGLLPQALVRVLSRASALHQAALPVTCAVSAALLTALCAVYARELLHYHRACPAQEETVRRWAAKHPLRRPLRICRSGRVQTPVCCGVLFPVIVLPESFDAADEPRLNCVLTHEYCHLLRFDPLWKLLALVCVCLYWYLPAAWLLCVLLRRDLEFACDESVLESGVPEKFYARTLLEMALRCGTSDALAAQFSAGQVSRRVDHILCYHRRPVLRMLCAALLLTLAVGFAAAPSVPASAEAAQAHLISERRVLTVPLLPEERALCFPEEAP
ncbi:MAG: M56 family metallopeptidase [Lachnospiraceae bacterium]|nr:M56 family metallopeptidase [Lachnospiraceae bacterium]